MDGARMWSHKIALAKYGWFVCWWYLWS